MTHPAVVLIPAARIERWFENFATRHGSFALDVTDGSLLATAEDGAVAIARLPWGRQYDGLADPAAYAASALAEVRWGVLLVRKGGFGIAAGTGPKPAFTKVGRRHVQGTTKAGGWSQQRYARRRDNQARDAYEAAADHAHRILIEEFGGVDALVCGGDRPAVTEVLSDRRLSGPNAVRVDRWLATADPKSDVLLQAVKEAWSVEITITDPR